MNDFRFLAKLYGVRGSYPIAPISGSQIGGNTTCLLVRTHDHIVLFDAGSGIIDAGKELLPEIFEHKKKPTYYLFSPKERGKAYVRVKDKTVQASREMVVILKRSKLNRSYPVRVGEKEQLLFRYIEKQGNTTLSEFMKVSGLSRYNASQTLVRLVVSNILQIEIGEKEDSFSMKSIN